MDVQQTLIDSMLARGISLTSASATLAFEDLYGMQVVRNQRGEAVGVSGSRWSQPQPEPSVVKCLYCGNVQALKDQCYGCGANLPRTR